MHEQRVFQPLLADPRVPQAATLLLSVDDVLPSHCEALLPLRGLEAALDCTAARVRTAAATASDADVQGDRGKPE